MLKIDKILLVFILFSSCSQTNLNSIEAISRWERNGFSLQEFIKYKSISQNFMITFLYGTKPVGSVIIQDLTFPYDVELAPGDITRIETIREDQNAINFVFSDNCYTLLNIETGEKSRLIFENRYSATIKKSDFLMLVKKHLDQKDVTWECMLEEKY